jgi:radical SAM protein with 4Fe4S-binding SPASM domain
MACPHCWVAGSGSWREQDQQPELTLDEYISTIEQLRPLGIKRLKLTGGEPLLRKEIVLSLCDYCRRNGLGLALETNATLLDKELMDALAGLRDFEIGISVDFPNDEGFDKFRKHPGAFARVNSAFRCLGAAGIGAVGIMTVFRDNLPLMFETASYVVEELGGSVKFSVCVGIGRAQADMKDRLLSPGQVFEYYDLVEQVADKYPGKIHSMIPMAFYRPGTKVKLGRCDPSTTLGLLPDGGVSLCGIGVTNKQAVFGNVRQATVLDIMQHSSELQMLGHSDEMKYCGVCSKCMFSQACGHLCPAHSFEMFGDYSGPYPVCQSLYESGLFPKDFLVGPHDHE